MSSESTLPSENPEVARAMMVKAATECEAGILISFLTTKNDEGEDVLQPRVNMLELNMATMLSADNVMRKTMHARMEYVTLDYVRLLQEAIAKKEAPDVP